MIPSVSIFNVKYTPDCSIKHLQFAGEHARRPPCFALLFPIDLTMMTSDDMCRVYVNIGESMAALF